MIVGVSIFELHLPGARSLKEKRRVVKSLIDKLHQRHRISIAETDLHDLHQRAEISIAIVGRRGGEIERLLDQVRRTIEESPDSILTQWNQELIEGVQ